MYQKSTQEKVNDSYKVLKEKDVKEILVPTEDTLAYIMQFASVYHVEKKLPDSLSGMILN